MVSCAIRGCVIGILALASPLAAQTPVVDLDPELPPELRRVIETPLETPGVRVSTGDLAIGASDTLSGSLAHYGGALVLEGRVEGDVTAVGSEVTMRPSAAIAGDLTVIGGAFYSTTMADVGGTTVWRRERVTVIDQDERLFVDYEPPPGDGFPVELKGFYGFVLDTYSGVDGLSFGLEAGLREREEGPRTELAGGPVFRTERDDVGWRVAGLREFPRAGGIVLGAGTYRVTLSPESWHRGDRGNGMASLFFADDDRTYHERTGYELWLEKSFPLAALTLRGFWRDDDFESLESEEPFAVFGDDDDWPVNPAVEEGQGRAAGLGFTWERRDDPKFATRGVFAEGRYEHWGFGDEFAFDWAQAQARAFVPLRTSEGSFAALRVMGGGRLGGGDTLAPQFLYRLGGGSTVPGYDALSPLLTGDRMVFATATVHQGLFDLFGERNRLYLVGIASVGDAWHPDEDVEWNSGFGGGLAIHGKIRYAGVFGVYGAEEEQWQFYYRLTPWF